MADKEKDQDKQEERPTGQQPVFPPQAAEESGLPPNVADPSAGLHEERGLEPPYAGDGTNTGMVHPRIDDEPGVTGIDRGTDPNVPSFIPDVTGPRVAGEDERAATAEERGEETADPVSRVAHNEARADRARAESVQADRARADKAAEKGKK